MHASVKARKTRFLKALQARRLSQAAWAKAYGLSATHLSQVLNGKRESVRLEQKIDAFAREVRAA